MNKEVVYKLASAVSMAVAPQAMRWAEHIARCITRIERISVVAPFDVRLREREQFPEFHPDTNPEVLIPGYMWERVSPLLPMPPKKKGRPLDIRHVLAAIVAHEIYGATWPAAAANCEIDFRTARRYLAKWENAGAWEKIRAVVTETGVTQVMSASAS